MTALTQDGDGFIWVGTQGGLLRWDGYRVRRYVANAKSADALHDNFIQRLHTDAGGRLWIGTGTAGLVREQLQLEAVDLPQRLDLVADEPAEAGVRRRRVRARHDQHPHGGRERTRERNCHRAVVELSHPGLEP